MRIAILFLTSTFGLFAITGCSSSKKSSSPDAGNTCKGVYSDKTLADLTTGASTGACTSAADLAVVCANDVNTTTSNCALGCNAQGGDAGTKVACTVACVKGQLNPPPTDACIACYADSVACALQYCLQPCLAGASDPTCTTCRVQHGCSGTFYRSCSGLPVPTGLNLGGAGGASSGTGGSAGASTGGTSSAGSANGGAGGSAGAH